MKFINLRSFDNYFEAHVVMGSLQQENITCWLKDEYSVTIDPLLVNAIGGIKLMVPESQAERAWELLEDMQKNNTE